MSQTIIFMRHGKLSLPYSSHDEMPKEILNELATGRLNPEGDPYFFDEHSDIFTALFSQHNIKHIFYSPSKRWTSMLPLLQKFTSNEKTKVEQKDMVNEIYFDLDVLFAHSQNVSLSQITPRLLHTIAIQGSGSENIKLIMKRFNDFIQQLPEFDDVLVLTHGYYMRVIFALLSQQSKDNIPTYETLMTAPRFGYFDLIVYQPDVDALSFIHNGL